MKRLVKLNWAILFACCVLIMPKGALAQMTIGGDIAPTPGAVLDLSPAGGHVGGLKLPNVALESLEHVPSSLTSIASPQDSNLALRGLVVYNTTTNVAAELEPGIHEWDGTKWLRTGASSGAVVTPPDGGTWFGALLHETVSARGAALERAPLYSGCAVASLYTHELTQGQFFASLMPSTLLTNGYKITFDANHSNEPRYATVLVTSPCGQQRTLIYTQSTTSTPSGTAIVGAEGGTVTGLGTIALWQSSSDATTWSGFYCTVDWMSPYMCNTNTAPGFFAANLCATVLPNSTNEVRTGSCVAMHRDTRSIVRVEQQP